MSEQLLEQINQYSAMIFDMDGTLLNSEHCHFAAWNHILKENGKGELTGDVIDAISGLPTIKSAEFLIKKFGLNDSAEDLTRYKRKIYFDLYMPKAEPFPLICELLRSLKTSGKRVAIATSSPISEANFLLTAAGVINYLDTIVTGDMVKLGKPNPDIYFKAAQELHTAVEDCLIFEDSLVGMQAVKNAHMAAVKVLDGHFDCDHVIEPDEIWTPNR